MAQVWLVRHGEPEAAWGGADPDPGLSPQGRRQAQAAARTLAALSPARLLTSPLRRCRETAEPLAALTGMAAEVAPEVAEIPTPQGVAAADRPAWLRRAFAGDWGEIEGGDYAAWRVRVAACVAQARGAVVFTHYVAINAAVSAALGTERVAGARPAHAAIVGFETDGRVLRLLDLGAQSEGAAL